MTFESRLQTHSDRTEPDAGPGGDEVAIRRHDAKVAIGVGARDKRTKPGTATHRRHTEGHVAMLRIDPNLIAHTHTEAPGRGRHNQQTTSLAQYT